MSDLFMVDTRAGMPLGTGALGGFGMSTAYVCQHTVAVSPPKRPIAARNGAQGGLCAWSPPV